MGVTKISWTSNERGEPGYTQNFWIGCTAVSPACDHCYAEDMSAYRGWAEWGPGKPRRRTSRQNWRMPLKWNRKAERDGVRHKVFVNSLSDFGDQEVPDLWRVEAFQVIRETPFLDYLLLTKRPAALARFLGYLAEAGDYPWQRIWAGTTTENQHYYDVRIADILDAPAAVHFVSLEPLLGPVRISSRLGPRAPRAWPGIPPARLDWAIVGAESGHPSEARPMDEDWVRALRDDCRRLGVAFYLKQYAEAGRKIESPELDGRQWLEFPASAGPVPEPALACVG